MGQPFFSVVIPLYNKADVVRRTLQSVQRQEFRDFEVIVVDDGSTDNGARIVEDFSDLMHMTLRLFFQRNSGVSAARNKGIREAAGRYVAFLDADDVWRANHLLMLFKTIQLFPEVAIVGSGYEQCAGNRILFTREHGRPRCCDLFSVCAYAPLLHTSATAVRREVLEQVGGFDMRHGLYEDWELFFKVAMEGCCCLTGKNTSVYEQDSSLSITGHVRRDDVARIYPHIQLLINRVREGRASREMRKFLLVHFLRVLSEYYRMGNLEKIKDLLPSYRDAFVGSKVLSRVVRIRLIGMVFSWCFYFFERVRFYYCMGIRET